MVQVINARKWGKRNVWRHAGGDLCVRPGMRRIYTPAAGESIVAAFSVRTDFPGGGDVAHYVVTRHATNGVVIRILDENLDVFQALTWSGSDMDPRAVTVAVVEEQLLVNSPDLPPLFGYVGSGLIFARSIASDTNDTVIEPPSGISVSFCNRIATAAGRLIYFSDPVSIDGGDLRSFVGFNVNGRPGIIYGLHERFDGMLVAVTTVGTYGLDADAAAVATVGFNGTAWRLLSHVSAHSYNSTCVHNGRIYALTERGMVLADSPSLDETELSDETMPRARGPSVDLPDYRTCRMISSQAGPIVAAPEIGLVHVTEMAHDLASWWRDWTSSPGDLRGLLEDHYGGEVWAMATGLYVLDGDFDGEIPLADADDEDQPIGTLFGRVPVAANDNNLPRKINVAGAVDGALRLFAAVRGSEHEADAGDPDDFGVIEGEDAWGVAEDKRWMPTPFANAEITFGEVSDTDATRDVSIEVSVEGAGVRMHDAPTMASTKSAATRPQRGG